ncbi:MAG: hypothetical protein JXD23_13010 [Spirochaetales bacterium]|nr:hypothetical protein [Spirochaetales bacterium]
MVKYFITGIGGGVALAILDGLVNANPLAVRLLAVYKPIARQSVNFIAGTAVDLAYGLILAALFIFLKPAYPSPSGLVNGLLFGAGAWFLRTAMSAVSQWIMFRISFAAVAYLAVAGLAAMLAFGTLFGLILG